MYYICVYMYICVCLCIFISMSIPIPISLAILNFIYGLCQFFSSSWPLLSHVIPISNVHIKYQLIFSNSIQILSPLWSLSFYLRYNWFFSFVYPLVLFSTSVTIHCFFYYHIFLTVWGYRLIEVRSHAISIVVPSIYSQQCLTHGRNSINICQILFVDLKI